MIGGSARGTASQAAPRAQSSITARVGAAARAPQPGAAGTAPLSTLAAANIGVALTLVSQPDRYADPALSDRVRDAATGTLGVACLTIGAAGHHPSEVTIPSQGRLRRQDLPTMTGWPGRGVY
jgi:hypothetical protein